MRVIMDAVIIVGGVILLMVATVIIGVGLLNFLFYIQPEQGEENKEITYTLNSKYDSWRCQNIGFTVDEINEIVDMINSSEIEVDYYKDAGFATDARGSSATNRYGILTDEINEDELYGFRITNIGETPVEIPLMEWC